MRKILILLTILIVLTGCVLPKSYTEYVPNEQEYWQTIKKLDTPEKIAFYLENNFEYNMHLYSSAKTPYQFWIDREGDCKDYAAFGVFAARYHGYEAYILHIFFKNSNISHLLGIYKEGDLYSFTDCWVYSSGFKTIDDCVSWYIYYSGYELLKYMVIG